MFSHHDYQTTMSDAFVGIDDDEPYARSRRSSRAFIAAKRIRSQSKTKTEVACTRSSYLSRLCGSLRERNSRRSSKEVEAQGGRVVALGRFQEAVAGDIKPRTVMILVEWKSKAACDGYCNDPPCIRTGKRAPATTSGTSSTSSRTCRYS